MINNLYEYLFRCCANGILKDFISNNNVYLLHDLYHLRLLVLVNQGKLPKLL